MGMGIGGGVGYPSPEQYDLLITQATQRQMASATLANGLELIRDALIALQGFDISDLEYTGGVEPEDIDGTELDGHELAIRRKLVEGIDRAFSGYARIHQNMAEDQDNIIQALTAEKARLAGLIVVPSLQPKPKGHTQ